jgi:hypothetical protein
MYMFEPGSLTCACVRFSSNSTITWVIGWSDPSPPVVVAVTAGESALVRVPS